MRKLTLTETAAQTLAENLAPAKIVCEQETPDSAPTYRPCQDIRLARLQSPWTQQDSGLWTATACFIVGDVGKIDSSFVFDVCAPLARSKPLGLSRISRFWVIWRGRWESLETPVSIPRYVGGNSISVTTNDDGDYQIDNYGLRCAAIPNDYHSQWGTLYFASQFFMWRTAEGMDGTKELSLKWKWLDVLTPNGTETIKVLRG